MEQNAPRLRFPGFSGEWEKKALGEIADRITRKNSNHETNRPLTISAEHGLVDQTDFFSKQVASENLEKYYLLYKNEFAYNRSAAKGYKYGVIRYLKAYEEGAVSTLYICFRLRKGSQKFLEAYFDSHKLDHQLKGATAEGSRNHGLLNITTDDFFKISLLMPSLPEQEKIADFFSALDEKIDLKEKEIEDVKALKKGFLQKMFPQDGEFIPRLRFPGFSGEWERKKLSQYLSVSTERNKDNIYGKKDVYSVSREKGVINQIEYQGRSFAGVSVSNYRILKTNDIVYTKSPLKANPYGIIETNKNNPGIVSTLYAVYNPLPNVLPVFVQIYFESDFRLNNYLKPLVNIGAKHDMKVKDENALKGIVTFPSLPEQEKIADFFSALDEKIDAMEKQLEDLKEMKKGFLQQMFI